VNSQTSLRPVCGLSLTFTSSNSTSTGGLAAALTGPDVRSGASHAALDRTRIASS
jgi:hypothetical protein